MEYKVGDIVRLISPQGDVYPTEYIVEEVYESFNVVTVRPSNGALDYRTLRRYDEIIPKKLIETRLGEIIYDEAR